MDRHTTVDLIVLYQSAMLHSEIGLEVGEPRPLVGLAGELLKGLLPKIPRGPKK